MARRSSKKHLAGGADDPYRVALYMRVSTGRQAERDLSIPDQRKQLLDYCNRIGAEVVAEFTDASTGTDDRRPGFQHLIDEATSGSGRFNLVVCHSFSRFFRGQIELQLYRRQLKKYHVDLISISQDLPDDSAGELALNIIALFDEFVSTETAKHVTRSLRENARQGFFSGGKPPFGFVSVSAGLRGDTVKKRLEINLAEAETVRLIFDLYLNGPQQGARMGVKRIAEHLNESGHRYRNDRNWGIGDVHRILTDTAYKGIYVFNRGGNVNEQVVIPVPEIVSPTDFDEVQLLLRQRNPSATPPRVTSSQVLLGGLAKCGRCGSSMTLRTGKSGRYRYYTCSRKAREGSTGCEGLSAPMPRIDATVRGAIFEAFFPRWRLEAILRAVAEKRRLRNSQPQGSEAQNADLLISTQN